MTVTEQRDGRLPDPLPSFDPCRFNDGFEVLQTLLMLNWPLMT
jgi:hypothetical protein